jgi:hypothetical protein
MPTKQLVLLSGRVTVNGGMGQVPTDKNLGGKIRNHLSSDLAIFVPY